jgi:hypothetical protein
MLMERKKVMEKQRRSKENELTESGTFVSEAEFQCLTDRHGFCPDQVPICMTTCFVQCFLVYLSTHCKKKKDYKGI